MCELNSVKFCYFGRAKVTKIVVFLYIIIINVKAFDGPLLNINLTKERC